MRALAQRSAEAAKEIKTLILTSSHQVNSGVELVSQTGRSLERILDEITQINGLVVSIATSAQEQAVGLQQVNTAVAQMDQVTQQNAAMVEESTASSHSLSKEADDLQSLLQHFQIGGVERPSAPVTMRRPVAPVKPAARRIIATGGAAVRKTAPVANADDWQEF